MKILIPHQIKENIDFIDNVWIETVDGQTKTSNLILLDSLKNYDFIDLPNSIFFKAHSIFYKINYKFGQIDFIYFEKKESAIYRGISDSILKCLRKNINTPYSDDEVGGYACLEDLNQKYLQSVSSELLPVGTKNLIYYSVYFNKGYVELFLKSIDSILANSKKNFDILVITDSPTLNLIKQSPLHKFLKYLITPSPGDGVEASKNKLKIFEWKDINFYDKILFLDCDIISIGDVNNIFKENIEHDYLYTAHNLNLTPAFFKTIYHGFEMLPDSFVEEMNATKQIPFNAGQFLFKNSSRMNSHFKNVIWFMNNWPLQYFFEQAFMCYYFAKAYMCKSTILQDNVSIVSAKDKTLTYQITPKTTLIHFIAPPLNAPAKLKFIENFLKDKNYTKKYVTKINWFKKIFLKLS